MLFGGRSGEHEVSLVSANSVIANLDKEKYEVIPVGITKQGRWISGPDSMKLLKSGNAPEQSNTLIVPEPNSPPFTKEGISGWSADKRIDVIFPVLHGPYGEDGTVQGFLELTGIPYVGCATLASAVCMDKVMQKKVLKAEDFTQVAFEWFWMKNFKKSPDPIIKKIEQQLQYPMFVKPANLGSSVGISKVKNQEGLIAAIEEAGDYDRKIIIEQGVLGVRELECSVIGNQNPKASIAGEIISSNEFYDYDAKYVDGKSAAKIPAEIDAEMMQEAQREAVRAYQALDCEGMARVDFLLAGDGVLYINELNTIPGFTSISMYPKLWEASGLTYPELLDKLIKFAIERSKEKKRLNVSYQPKQKWYNE